jgi:integrase/recombinase XerD
VRGAAVLLKLHLAAVQIAEDREGPLFRSLDREHHLAARRLRRFETRAVITRRVRQAGLPYTICCHTFRATGITTYLQNGGRIKSAQRITNYESSRKTKFYDRTNDAIRADYISLDERACPAVPGRACPAFSGIERILI